MSTVERALILAVIGGCAALALVAVYVIGTAKPVLTPRQNEQLSRFEQSSAASADFDAYQTCVQGLSQGRHVAQADVDRVCGPHPG